ncbi:hypothetical protein BK133_21135 [Paenibacillus sp. FSL H8-0548]|uniref:hypothetical protein n=1 Tax=Paenibacillus sp. FSL H8-0548 TaxID=1920422 RepID=UPI00096ECFC0|nr:hypothetical protein [Paenibacillus sp. FSL H8-0548]OMF25828.1 hypothetical protein BK133_21135 [Paenibacillus sp. FSL H8-0548]
MKWIAEMPYYKVGREIIGNEQITVIDERFIHLYADKITTRYHEFLIRELFDISYRHLGSTEGFLYLHTKHGIFSFSIKTDPTGFIKVVRAAINKKHEQH